MTGPLGILQVSGLLKIHLLLGACRPSSYNVCPRQPQLLQQVFVSSLDHGWLHREMVTLDISGIASISAIDFTSVMTASGNGFAIQSFQIFYMSWCWHSVLCTNPFHADTYRNVAFHFWSLENQIVNRQMFFSYICMLTTVFYLSIILLAGSLVPQHC